MFSNNYQASASFERVEGTNPGALVEIQFTFNPSSNQVVDVVEADESEAEAARSLSQPKALPPRGKVTKRFTVGEAPALSLLASSKVVPFRRRVTLYGWARYGSANEVVKISQQSRIAALGRKRGVVKKLRLNAEGKFITSIKMLETDKFKATHVSAGGIASGTRPLRIVVRGGGRRN